MRPSLVHFVLASLLVVEWPADAAAQGCDVSWTNPASGFWETATNWSTGAIPTATQNTCIVVNGTYTVTLNSNRSVASLTIGGGRRADAHRSILQ